MNRSIVVLIAAAAVIFGVVFACGSPSTSVCTPGQANTCTGDAGCQGMQVCRADGVAYDACQCGPPGGSDAGDAGHGDGGAGGGSGDAGNSDAGADSGTPDGGASDDGGTDGGDRDGGAVDAGPAVTVTILVTQDAGFLSEPRAIAFSPKDGLLYVADRTAAAPCNGACIRTVNPSTGSVSATPVVTGVGTIEGIAFDATADALYYSDRQDRIVRMIWTGSGYATATACVDASASNPRDPYHLVVDFTLGILVADGDSATVRRVSVCSATSSGTAFSSNANLGAPRGLAMGPAGEIFVSDNTNGSIVQLDRNTGIATRYSSATLDQPLGIVWLGGTSPWAGSLLVASSGSSTLDSVTSAGATRVTTLASPPVDVTLSATGHTAYVLSSPSGTQPGRIYVVDGF